MARICITTDQLSAEAELNDTKTAALILAALPLEAAANTWGDEVYFSVPVTCAPENAHEVVELGELGYWPAGSAFCIFFGPTPISRCNEIRPASAVNVFGKVIGDPTVFKSVRTGEIVRLTVA